MKKGVPWIIGGVAVFVVCSIIQGVGGSSMFTDSYHQSGNVILDLLINISWWPGWILTVVLVGRGALMLFQSRGSGSN